MIQDFFAVLENKRQLAGEVWGFRFNMKNGETLNFLPGQYLLLKIEDNYRQYSISSSNMDPENFEFIIEYFPNGLASVFLQQLSVGGEAHFKGPAGVFTLKETPRDKVFLATGTGIAPIKSMIETHLKEQREGTVSLFFGLKTKADVYMHDIFMQLQKNYPEKFFYTLCLSREENITETDTNMMKGHIQDALEIFWKDHTIGDYEYYVCGSKPAVESLKEFVFSKGVQQDSIFFERFTL